MATAINKVTQLQKAITDVTKDSKGDGRFTFDYLTLGKILEQIRPVMLKLELGFEFGFNESTNVTMVTNAKGNTEYLVQGNLFLNLVDLTKDPEDNLLLSAETFAASTHRDPAKAVGSLITYHRRYLLEQILNIAGNVNLDPDETPNKVETPSVPNGDPKPQVGQPKPAPAAGPAPQAPQPQVEAPQAPAPQPQVEAPQAPAPQPTPQPQPQPQVEVEVEAPVATPAPVAHEGDFATKVKALTDFQVTADYTDKFVSKYSAQIIALNKNEGGKSSIAEWSEPSINEFYALYQEFLANN